jgi:hypothetical protein
VGRMQQTPIPRTWRGVVLIGVCVLTMAVPLRSQGNDVEWSIPAADVNAGDRRAILELARRFGINDPQRVSVLNAGCLTVRVDSKVTVEGNRLRSQSVLMRRNTGPGCTAARGKMKRVGNWITGLETALPVVRWRVRDEDWHVDMYLGEGVSYENAAVIVRSIRRNGLTDRRQPQDQTFDIPYIDASTITYIRRPHQTVWTSPGDSRDYEVMTGESGGFVLLVRIVDGSVEVHRAGGWQT